MCSETRTQKSYFMGYMKINDNVEKMFLHPAVMTYMRSEFLVASLLIFFTFWSKHQVKTLSDVLSNGPLTRFVKLRVTHAPGMPGTFSPPTRVSDPGIHHGTCRHACRDRKLAVSYEVGGGENVSGISGGCATHSFTYLVRGPYNRPEQLSIIQPDQ